MLTCFVRPSHNVIHIYDILSIYIPGGAMKKLPLRTQRQRSPIVSPGKESQGLKPGGKDECCIPGSAVVAKSTPRQRWVFASFSGDHRWLAAPTCAFVGNSAAVQSNISCLRTCPLRHLAARLCCPKPDQTPRRSTGCWHGPRMG
jgi:hypothetical protein